MGEDRKSECCYSSLSYPVTFCYVACVGGGDLMSGVLSGDCGHLYSF